MVGGEWRINPAVSEPRAISAKRVGNATFLYDSSKSIEGHAEASISLDVDTYRAVGSGNISVSEIRCHDGSHEGTGTITADRIGNFSISNGTGHTIKGGYVEGNFQVSGGAGVTLRGVTIRGTLDVDDANTTVHLKGCHIQGDINIEDQSGVSVTMDGGAYMGSLTDPGTNFTRNAGS